MKITLGLAAALTAAAVGALAVATPVSAHTDARAAGTALLSRQATSQSELRQQVTMQLKLYPGGKQVADNEVSYDGGKVTVSFAKPGTAQPLAGAECPSGYVCVYEYANYGYPRLKLDQGLGWYDLYYSPAGHWNDRASSVHNNLDCANGWAQFQNHAAGHSDHSSDQVLFELDHWRALPTLGANDNKVDHVVVLC
jgi:hypothetical protein